MKLFVYTYKDFDEGKYFDYYCGKYDVQLGKTALSPTMETAELAQGYDALSIITTPIDAALMERFAGMGIKMISTRTVGYDHIDLEAAERFGVEVGNVPTSPYSVSDYTVMLILMAIRKLKRLMQRCSINDFSVRGLLGMELHNCTVGVVGTGHIGQAVIRALSGFGCRILAYDPFESLAVKEYAQYVPLEQLYRESDIIDLHAPMSEENEHMICKETIALMKPGVLIVNTARGGLIHTGDLIDALISGKVGGAALDVIEREGAMFYHDLKTEILDHRELMILKELPNVIFTHHMAYYTDQAMEDRVHYSVESCWRVLNGMENPWKVRASQ